MAAGWAAGQGAVTEVASMTDYSTRRQSLFETSVDPGKASDALGHSTSTKSARRRLLRCLLHVTSELRRLHL